MKRKYYNYCVEVFYWNEEEKCYKLWFVPTFSSKKNLEIWLDGFKHGQAGSAKPCKIGLKYVKYLEYKPDF